MKHTIPGKGEGEGRENDHSGFHLPHTYISASITQPHRYAWSCTLNLECPPKLKPCPQPVALLKGSRAFKELGPTGRKLGYQ
jgi:hypothetical protein